MIVFSFGKNYNSRPLSFFGRTVVFIIFYFSLSLSLSAVGQNLSSLPPGVVDFEAVEPDIVEGRETVDLGYHYRQKGMRALGDGIFSSAVRFFSAYREQTQGIEPDFTDATILLLRVNLLKNDLSACREVLDHYDRHSQGTDDEFYHRNMLFWRAVVLVADDQAERGLEVVEPLLEDDLYPELQERILLLTGDAYARLGRWQEADQMINAFLERFPDSPWHQQAMFNLFKTAVVRGEDAKAEELLLSAESALEEETPQLILNRLFLHLGRGEIEEALQLYGRIEDYAPSDYERTWWLVFSQLSRKLLSFEQWEDALPVLARSLVLAPTAESRAEIMLMQVKSKLALGLEDRAKITLSSFVNQFPEHPRAAESLFRLAMLAADMNDRDAAIEHYETIVRDSSLPSNLRYQCAINLGRLLMSAEEYEKALGVFSQARALPVDNDYQAAALMLAGESAMALSDYLVAADVYASIAEDFEETEYAPTARMEQGRALVEAGRERDAASVFKLFIEEYPDDDKAAPAWLGKAMALRDAGDAEESMAAFEEFVEAYPEHEKAPFALLEVYKLARNDRDMQHSMQALNRICTRYSDSDLYVDALYHRIYIAFLAGDYDLALTEGERFIVDFAEHAMAADVLLWMADYYRNQGDYAEAETNYRQVYRRFPRSEQAAIALYEAAAVAFSNQDEEGCARALRRLERIEERNQTDGIDVEVWARAAFLRGDVLAFQNQFKAAIEWFERVPGETAEKELALLARGRVADMHFSLPGRESDQKAASIYREILQDKDLDKWLQANISYRLAKTLEQLGEQAEALDLYLDIVFSYDIEIRAGRVRDWYYFARAGYDAARILLDNEEHYAAARVYERIYRSQIPTSEEARQRAHEIRDGQGLDEQPD